MLFNPLWFWALRRELEDRLKGSLVTGGQIVPAGLRITLEGGGEPLDLVLWLDPRFARAEYIASRRVAQFNEPWSLLTGSTLTAVNQPDFDRRLTFSFEKDDFGWVVDFRAFAKPVLTMEQTGDPRRNVATLGPGRVTDVQVTKPFLLEMKGKEAPQVDSPLKLTRVVRGLDKLWIEAALEGSGKSSASEVETAWQFVQDRIEDLITRPISGGYGVWEGDRAVGLSVIDLSLWLPRFRFEPYPSLSETAGRFVHVHRRQLDLAAKRSAMLGRGREIKSRLRRRLSQLLGDREKQQHHATWRENADWLTARLGQIKKGQDTLEIPTSDGVRKVALDPALRPHMQADRWYHRSRRLKRGLSVTVGLIKKTETELQTLERMLEALDGRAESTLESLNAVWDELADRVERAPAKQSVRLPAPQTPFRRYRSPGGLAIWVGRNNKENDELTLHKAHKHDLWFHAQQTPGSHVVLRSHMLNQMPARADIVAAAAVAAYHSRARTSSKVPVIYTEARYVRKPRKAAPGEVAVEREKSVMVEPALPPKWDTT